MASQSTPRDQELRKLTEQASAAGQITQAHDLCKAWYELTPTDEVRERLHRQTLLLARHFRQSHRPADALRVLKDDLEIPGLNAPEKKAIALERAACGDLAGAIALDDSITETVADWAIRFQGRGARQLPPSFGADCKRTLEAFAELEAGQDDKVSEILDAIGLRSPFLEWKLALRGLQAFYVGDDARAISNWQRLKTERFPARLVAAYRSLVDPEFVEAQTPEMRQRLKEESDKLQSPTSLTALRDLQRVAGKGKSLVPLFRQAEVALNRLEAQLPSFGPRLRQAMYWTVLQNGKPEDVPRYLKTFGPPPEDPELDRLQALAWERSGEIELASKHWQKFEKYVDRPESPWKEPEASFIRALIWHHLGEFARKESQRNSTLNRFRDVLQIRPHKIDPKNSAEKCFRRSIALVPDHRKSWLGLLQALIESAAHVQALETARTVVQRFPDDLELLATAASYFVTQNLPGEALETYRAALKLNPLDRGLRLQLASLMLTQARAHAEKKQIVQARPFFEQCLNFQELEPEDVWCRWAVAEIKAGEETRAEELLAKAISHSGSELVVHFLMLVEVIRLKLPPKWKTRFNTAFNSGLSRPPTAHDLALLAQKTAAYHQGKIGYVGQKTHAKKVVDCLKQVVDVDFSEDQLEKVCVALIALGAQRVCTEYIRRGRERFPRNPSFLLYQIRSYKHQDYHWRHLGELRRQLVELDNHAASTPADRRHLEVLEEIRHGLQELENLNTFPGGIDFFREYFGRDEEEDF